MKIGIFNPYLDTLGGGEKYTLTAAWCLSKIHEVCLFWDSKEVIKKAHYLFALDLSKIKLTENIFSLKIPLAKRLLKTQKYDVIIYVSDGSIPLSFASKNILIFQFPVNWVNGKNFLTRLKLSRINRVICYSQFVKGFLDKTFSVDSLVLPPAINIPKNKSVQKENIILTVGRFTKGMNTKKQEVLIDTFKSMCSKGLANWKFILVGGVLPGDWDFVEELKNKTKGYPIEILNNISFQKLASFYKKAKIYWHAAGFGEDLEKHPEKAEHFGVTTVEAMASGCVPVVINAGGQKEIVQEGRNGMLWDTLEELKRKTMLLNENDSLRKRLSGNAQDSSKQYGVERFCSELYEIVET